MPTGRPRYQLSREEIGILLSYAKRPEAVTQKWMIRLQSGISRADLSEFVALAGLPRNTVERIMNTRSVDDGTADGDWSNRSPAFRRALIVVIALSVGIAITLTFATMDATFRGFVVATILALCGYGLYQTIARLSGGMR